MGFWRDLKRFVTLESAVQRVTFDASPVSQPYMPIDQMFLAMYQGMGRVSRADALSIPGVKRARDIICSSVATLPLEQLDSKNNLVPLPLLEQIDPNIPNVVTLAQTLEDLFFEGISWWRVLEKDANDFPIYAEHLEYTSVRIQNEVSQHSLAPLPGGYDPRRSTVYYDGVEVPWENLRRFDSPNAPLLTSCARTIKRAIAFDRVSEMYAKNPRPADYFTANPDGEQLTDDQVREQLDLWMSSRQLETTGFVRPGWIYNTVDSPAPRELQLVELQNKVALDIAVATGLDPSDLGVSVTTDTYANKVDKRKDRINDVLSPYMSAITQRLSMGDTTRRGYRVCFDLDDYLRADPLTRAQVNAIYLDKKVITVDEVRDEENLPDLTDEQRAELKPEPATPTGQQDQVADEELPENVTRIRQTNSAGKRITFEFEAPVSVQLNFITEHFNVDRERRTIEGTVVPYGPNKLAYKDGRWWRFAEGSLRYTEQSRNKLLRDHDQLQPLGPMVHDEDRPTGRFARYKVGRGAEGDRALEEAEDKVRDGLSVGVEILKFQKDPLNKGAFLVTDAVWFETSVVGLPAFDDARATKVTASRDQGVSVDDTTTEPQAPAAPAQVPAAVPDMQELFTQFMQTQFANAKPMQMLPPVAPENQITPQEMAAVINPTRNRAVTLVREQLPYRFDRGGNFQASEHLFSQDLRDMSRASDLYGTETDAGRRVMALLRESFAQIVTTDINELNPTIQRPDLYVDQRDLPTPLWDMISHGTPPNGVQPFMFPKFSSSSGLVGDHTEGTEPTPGTLVTTSQTVQPTPLSGKANLTREVFDMGGNPAVSTLIFNQMVRSWREGLETSAATFLNTLTAADDINLGVGTADAALQAAWDSALADLQFGVRSYDFSALAVEKWLYKAFVNAKATDGRKLFPIINPQNANGTATERFRKLNLSGVVGIPAGALGAVSGSANNSWLFDPATVWAWSTPPVRLEFPGGGSNGTSYQPVASVDIAVWGYKAFANTDIGGVRQVIYDTN